MARLKDILEGVECASTEVALDIEIKGIACHSKCVGENYIFVAVKGARFDGHSFIQEAMDRGACAVVAQSDFPKRSGLKKIIVRDSKRALSRMSHNFYGRPSQKLKVIGITGTNGKTSTSYLVERVLSQAGYGVGVIGTICYKFGQRLIPATNTTPGPLELHSLLNMMAADSLDYVAMEVSSHSLHQHRVDDLFFETAVFTNLSPEHLDYHKTYRGYQKAKARLFKELKGSTSSAVINTDDEFGERLKEELSRGPVLTYGIEKTADVRGYDMAFTPTGTCFKISTPKGDVQIKSNLIGKYNLYNILAAVAVGLSEGVALEEIKAGIEGLKKIPGRLEEIVMGQPFRVFVDYAHTEDALREVLFSLKDIVKKRILTVFGCGGDRDRDKRPKMGGVSTKLSDYVIITSDNPRTEEPQSIVEEVISGIEKGDSERCQIVLDRFQAINKALSLAQPEDIVLIAGKGHETYQILKDTVFPFDDREVIRKILEGMGYRSNSNFAA